MLKSYPAIFHREEQSYWVEFPNFGGGTQGDNIEEALCNAREFLSSQLALMIDDGLPLPEVADINDLVVVDGFTSMVQADPSPYIENKKTVRKNVTVPEWLVRLADKQNINYSETLTKALEMKLEI